MPMRTNGYEGRGVPRNQLRQTAAAAASSSLPGRHGHRRPSMPPSSRIFEVPEISQGLRCGTSQLGGHPLRPTLRSAPHDSRLLMQPCRPLYLSVELAKKRCEKRGAAPRRRAPRRAPPNQRRNADLAPDRKLQVPSAGGRCGWTFPASWPTAAPAKSAPPKCSWRY